MSAVIRQPTPLALLLSFLSSATPRSLSMFPAIPGDLPRLADVSSRNDL
jgi:hypothetical protein